MQLSFPKKLLIILFSVICTNICPSVKSAEAILPQGKTLIIGSRPWDPNALSFSKYPSLYFLDKNSSGKPNGIENFFKCDITNQMEFDAFATENENSYKSIVIDWGVQQYLEFNRPHVIKNFYQILEPGGTLFITITGANPNAARDALIQTTRQIIGHLDTLPYSRGGYLFDKMPDGLEKSFLTRNLTRSYLEQFSPRILTIQKP